MAMSGRPRTPKYSAEETAKRVRQEAWRSQRERDKLLGDLCWYWQTEREVILQALELPPEYDLDHGHGQPRRPAGLDLNHEQRRPSHAPLPLEAVELLVESVPDWQDDAAILEQVAYQQRHREASGRGVGRELAWVLSGIETVKDRFNEGFEEFLGQHPDLNRNNDRDTALREYFQWIVQLWWLRERYAAKGTGPPGDSELASMLWEAVGPPAKAGHFVFDDDDDEISFSELLSLEDAAVDFLDKLIYRRRGRGKRLRNANAKKKWLAALSLNDELAENRQSPRQQSYEVLGRMVDTSAEAVRKAVQRERRQEEKSRKTR